MIVLVLLPASLRPKFAFSEKILLLVVWLAFNELFKFDAVQVIIPGAYQALISV
jgi:hypothetical protein